MSFLPYYNPDVCDGHECICDCDECSYGERAMLANSQEEEEDDD